MAPADDVHVQELVRMFQHAKHLIVWIAIALLIKGHVDMSEKFEKLGKPCLCETPPIAPASTFQHVPVQPFSSELLGDTVVQGNLTVEGCILWRQTGGAVQNLCTAFTELFKDCVHGVFDPATKRCLCAGPWGGNLCDRHTCFFRGLFDVSAGVCTCNPGFSAASMCEMPLTISGQDFCENGPCQGVCIDNECVCTESGQIGPLCYRCASPIINTTLCPGRRDWGKDYIDSLNSFAVCGGGYDLDSVGTLRIRGLPKCSETDCQDFHLDKSACCNPQRRGLCPNWAVWIFNADDFVNETQPLVFNSVYQKRYTAIIQNHVCDDDECVYRAHQEIQTTDWPLLIVGTLENKGYYIKRSSVYLGLDDLSAGHLRRAVWKDTPTQLYLKSTAVYYYTSDKLLHYIFAFSYPNTFCLGGEPLDPVTKTLLYGDEVSNAFADHSYWINLRDKAGSVLPAANSCGMFLPTDTKGPVLVRTPGASLKLFLGPFANNGAYYYPSSYGTVIV